MTADLAILAICGHDAERNAACIETLAGAMRRKNLLVAVVARGADDTIETLLPLAERNDLVLVDGRPDCPQAKIWLLAHGEDAPPAGASNIIHVAPADACPVASVAPAVEVFLRERCLGVPVLGCVLIGGRSTRMGRPKHLLPAEGPQGGATWLERTVDLLGEVCEQTVIAGAGEIPKSLAGCEQLSDADDADGPMAGLLAAMRGRPAVSWLVAACDLPGLTREALEWLISTRAPGVWATLPRLEGAPNVEPLAAHYDLRCRSLLEELARKGELALSSLARSEKVASPAIPPHLAGAWRNVNSPADLNSL